MKYYYSINNKLEGLVTLDELIKINLMKQTLIWLDGLSDWDVAENIEELKDFFKSKNTSPPLPTSKTINPPSLPKKPNKSSEKYSIKQNLLLETFKNEYLNKSIYHSEKQFSNRFSAQIVYIKKSKLKWFSTQLNNFIVVGTIESRITKQLIQDS